MRNDKNQVKYWEGARKRDVDFNAEIFVQPLLKWLFALAIISEYLILDSIPKICWN